MASGEQNAQIRFYNTSRDLVGVEEKLAAVISNSIQQKGVVVSFLSYDNSMKKGLNDGSVSSSVIFPDPTVKPKNVYILTSKNIQSVGGTVVRVTNLLQFALALFAYTSSKSPQTVLDQLVSLLQNIYGEQATLDTLIGATILEKIAA
jgi:hypothetical protein